MLRYMDGFDHYDTARIAEKWTSFDSVGSSIGAPGRFGSVGCLKVGSGPGTTLAIANGIAGWVIGVAVAVDALPSIGSNLFGLITIYDSASHPGFKFRQLYLAIDPAGRLLLYRGVPNDINGTVLIASSQPGVFRAANVYQYVELKATIDPAAGAYAVRLDGFAVPGLPDAAGVNTAGSGVAGADSMGLGYTSGGVGTTGSFDDLYVADQTGGAPHVVDFLGPVRVQTLFPTADATLEQWTMNPDQGAGGHFHNVNQNPPDDDTTYNSSLTPGQIDTFRFAGLVGNPAHVYGLQLVADARKDDSSGRQITTVQRAAGVNHLGANHVINDGWDFWWDTFDVNPATGVVYTPADINGLEAGYQEVV